MSRGSVELRDLPETPGQIKRGLLDYRLKARLSDYIFHDANGQTRRVRSDTSIGGLQGLFVGDVVGLDRLGVVGFATESPRSPPPTCRPLRTGIGSGRPFLVR